MNSYSTTFALFTWTTTYLAIIFFKKGINTKGDAISSNCDESYQNQKKTDWILTYAVIFLKIHKSFFLKTNFNQFLILKKLTDPKFSKNFDSNFLKSNVKKLTVFYAKFLFLGSAESLMAGSESSTEESEDQTVESLRRNSESTSAGSSLNNPRRNRQYKCVPCSKFFTSEWHLKAHLIKHADGKCLKKILDYLETSIKIA